MNLAPVLIFAYNRFEHLQKTIESLSKNYLANQSEIFIYSDGEKTSKDHQKIKEIRTYLKNLQGFKKINLIFRPENLGLANSIIKGVSEIITIHKKVIVLEDDMISTPDFLNFMNDALLFYETEKKIFTISGYNFPIKIPQNYQKDVFITQRASSWGWATWEDRWQKADWQVNDYQSFIKNKKEKKAFKAIGEDLVIMLKKQQKGIVNSWAIRWIYTHFKHNAFCLYPIHSKIQNIGTDNTGTHTPDTTKFEVMFEEKKYEFTPKIEENKEIKKNMCLFFKPHFFKKITNFLKYKEF